MCIHINLTSVNTNNVLLTVTIQIEEANKSLVTRAVITAMK